MPRIVLRDVIEEDLSFLYQIQREPKGYEMGAFNPKSEEEFFLHWHEKILGNAEVTARIIQMDGELVGEVASFVREGRRLVGYRIVGKHWGRGIATAALTEFLAVHEKRRPLAAFVATKNVASYRVLQKCGFQQIGQSTISSDGFEEFRMERVN